jgi:hypothetical protein
MACSSCANPFEIVTESTATCNCGTVAGTVPSQGNGVDGTCCVVSVNGKDGVVVLNINDIDLLGNQFFTNALVYTALSALAPINFNPGTGQITHLTSGVTPGTYGSSTQIPIVTVNDKGHITGMNTASISSTFLSANLQNLDTLTGIGYLVKTATNTWAFRSLQGSAGKIVISQPLGTASNSIIDLQNGIITPGTYGNTTQYPIVTVDTYGRVTGISLQAITSGAGDNWGAQVVQHDATLSGTGIIANLLKLAQQGATTGQTLIWNGSTWVPGNPALAISTGEFVHGNGSIATPLEVDRLVKIEDLLFSNGGTETVVCSIHGIIDYTAASPTTNKNILIRFVVRIYIDAVTADGYINIYINGGVFNVYKGYFIVSDGGGVAVPEFLIDQSVTTPNNMFVKGMNETFDSTINVITSLPKYYKMTVSTGFTPDIQVNVDAGITCRIGITYEVDKLISNRYLTW